jgi:predicted nucleotidyltransferase
MGAMKRDQIIATLKAAEPELRKRGIRHAALFGSVARGEERPDSDIDILIEFEPGEEGSIYDYVRLKEFVAGLFEGPVDVINRDALKPHVRAPAARDTVYAF